MKEKKVKTGLTTKILKNDGHTFKCDVCYEMERRGYTSEQKYFDDCFSNTLKPIKYKLLVQVDKKTFDKWSICTLDKKQK